MKKLTIKELILVCNRATSGPWHYFQHGRALKADCSLTPKHIVPKEWNICKFPMRTNKYPISHDEYEANCELLAACSPEIVASLCRMSLLYLKQQNINENTEIGNGYD